MMGRNGKEGGATAEAGMSHGPAVVPLLGPLTSPSQGATCPSYGWETEYEGSPRPQGPPNIGLAVMVAHPC